MAEQGGHPVRRYAAPGRPRGGRGLVEAAVEPLEQLDLLLAQAVEHDAHAGVQAELDLAAAAPQGPELLLEARPRDHRGASCRSRVRVERPIWHKDPGRLRRRPQGQRPGATAGHRVARERREGRARASGHGPAPRERLPEVRPCRGCGSGWCRTRGTRPWPCGGRSSPRPALGLALLLALHAVELALVGLFSHRNVSLSLHGARCAVLDFGHLRPAEHKIAQGGRVARAQRRPPRLRP